MSNDFLPAARALEPWLIERRRDFHRHPELAFQEVRTAGIVAQELTALGLEVATGIAQTGVVGLLEGERPGPTVLARFDMDALPIQEANATDYVSQTPGVMHACGHDGHTAIGLAVARLLAARRHDLAGTVKFVFQPAEEVGGAEPMVKAGVLENPRPDVSLGMHLWNRLPVGTVGAADGPVMAASERVLIKLTGQGGHGAMPDLVRDPIVAAAHIVTALQTVAARNLSPLEAGVVSITAVIAGEAFNVIPDRAELRGTLRSFRPDVRQLLMQRVRQVAVGVAQALGCAAEVTFEGVTPPVVNDPGVAAQVRALAAGLVGAENVRTDEVTMGAEDMAFLMTTIPGCYFFVGAANAERGLNYAHHHPRFDFDESVLAPAAALMASAVGRYVLP